MISKTEARYQDDPKATMMCKGCSMFRRHDSCTLVKGEISPHGWCRHWERREE